MRITWLLFLFLLALSARAGEQWYVFSIADTPVGYVVEESDGSRTRLEHFFRLTRLGKSLEMRFQTKSVESEGQLRSLTFEVLLSKQATVMEAHVEGDKVRIVTAPHERSVDRGGEPLLGPRAIARLSARRLRRNGDSIQYAIFAPELQKVANATRRVVAVGDTACDGTKATRVEETIEGAPAPRTFWMNADGLVIGDLVAGPFGPMRSCRSTREIALAANGTLPPDLYERTLAKSNIRFADPFAIDRVVLRITRRDASHPLPNFETHNQKTLAKSADSVTVEVRRDGGAGTPDAEYLQPNAIVQSDDPAIAKLAADLKKATPRETALELTRWVAENVSMDAGIIMAPASELMRDRRATCMGFATLLATLGRAAGIPSRIAMGYVYYGGIWGGHAWSEMLIDDRWLPLDAAVYAPGTASAGRLAAGSSSFADGGGSMQAALGALFGRVDIAALEYDAAGRNVRIAPDAQPFLANGSTYENAALGMKIDAAGWTVERADALWPSTLVVAFRRGENVVELHHRPAQPQRPIAREGDALFVESRGGMLWVWSARGPEASAALRQFLQ